MPNQIQEKVLAALSGLIPADAHAKVSQALHEAIDAAVAEVDAQRLAEMSELKAYYEAKLHEAEQISEKGYAEAYEMITELRHSRERLREEFERQLEEGYEEAYQMLLAERKKNDNLEVDLYEEYDGRVGEIREYLIEKVDRFLGEHGDLFFDAVKREVLNDPGYAEHKVTLERVLEAVQPFLSDEDYAQATSSRVHDLERKLHEQTALVRSLEARTMRLHTENTKLNEVARQAHDVLAESARVERNARRELARNVQSRGQRVANDQVQVIAEVNNPAAESDAGRHNQRSGNNMTLLEQWRALSGLTK